MGEKVFPGKHNGDALRGDGTGLCLIIGKKCTAATMGRQFVGRANGIAYEIFLLSSSKKPKTDLYFFIAFVLNDSYGPDAIAWDDPRAVPA
jgi:hypothetical protein